MYVVVITRIAPSRPTTPRSSSSSVTTPLHTIKAQIKSTLVALWSSAFSCEPIDGCLRSLTSSSFAVSGTCGRSGRTGTIRPSEAGKIPVRSSAGLRSSYGARSSGPRCSARRFESVAGSGLLVVRIHSATSASACRITNARASATSSARRSTRFGSMVSSCASSAAVTSSSRKPGLRGSRVMRANSFPCIAWRRGLTSPPAKPIEQLLIGRFDAQRRDRPYDLGRRGSTGRAGSRGATRGRRRAEPPAHPPQATAAMTSSAWSVSPNPGRA